MYLLKSLNISFWARHSYRLDGGEIWGNERMDGSACRAIENPWSTRPVILDVGDLIFSSRTIVISFDCCSSLSHPSLRLLFLSSTNLT